MTKVNIYVVLDESGSMMACRDATISGFNEYISTLRDVRAANETDYHVTLTKFHGITTNNWSWNDGTAVNVEYRYRHINKVPALNYKSYSPSGSTPLYDAIAETLNGAFAHFSKKIMCSHSELIPTQWNQTKPLPTNVVGCCDRNYSCPVCSFGLGETPHVNCNGWGAQQKNIVVIITDGEENSSVKNNKSNILQLIEQKQQNGFDFVYIGANQDAWTNGMGIGIKHILNYDVSRTHNLYTALASQTKNYAATSDAVWNNDEFVVSYKN